MLWTVVLEKTLESPLASKKIQPVHPKGNQSWIFIGRTDVEAKTPILWPPDVKSWLIWKDPDAGKDWRREEKGMTEDGWMASLTQWTWVCVNSKSWWWIGRPGVLQSIGLQRVGHSWATELNGLEKEKATHFSILAWKIPWTEKPGRLQCMGSLRFRHSCATSLSLSFHFLTCTYSIKVLYFQLTVG